MKKALKAIGIVDPEMIAENAEIGAAVAAEFAREAMEDAADDDLPAVPPRYLAWSDLTEIGRLIKTDRAEILVPPGRDADFKRMLAAMIHPGFWVDLAGSC